MVAQKTPLKKMKYLSESVPNDLNFDGCFIIINFMMRFYG